MSNLTHTLILLPLLAIACRNGGDNGATRAATNLAAAGCPGPSRDSDAVPRSPVDLGPNTRGELAYVPGPAERTAVRSEAEWESAWKRAADTMPRPIVNLRDSILILVASQEYTTSPYRLEIEDIRKCRDGGDVVVLLRLHSQQQKNEYGARSMRALMISRSIAGTGAVRFVDLSPEIAP